VVSPSDARRLADQVGIPFFETSAKENKNVEEVGDGCHACFRSRNSDVFFSVCCGRLGLNE